MAKKKFNLWIKLIVDSCEYFRQVILDESGYPKVFQVDLQSGDKKFYEIYNEISGIFENIEKYVPENFPHGIWPDECATGGVWNKNDYPHEYIEDGDYWRLEAYVKSAK